MLGENDLPIHDPNDPLGQPIPVITPATPQDANPLAISMIGHEERIVIQGNDITVLKSQVGSGPALPPYDDAAAEADEKTKYGFQWLKGTMYSDPAATGLKASPYFNLARMSIIYHNNLFWFGGSASPSFSLSLYKNTDTPAIPCFQIVSSATTCSDTVKGKSVVLVVVSNNVAYHISLGSLKSDGWLDNGGPMLGPAETATELARLAGIHNSLAKECKFRVYIRTV